MATYAIGDLQGCFKSLDALLKKIAFSPKTDTLWFVGDLVNRGAQSLECLEFVCDLHKKNAAKMVLGNHDIFLLACAEGFQTPKKGDTLDEILNSPKLAHFVGFLKKQPLVFLDKNFCMVHAGILPSWSLKTAESRARHVENFLQTKKGFLKEIWGNSKNGKFDEERFTINVFTRMRFLKRNNGDLDFDFKGEIANAPPDLMPWFCKRKPDEKILITGHWSALGLKITPHWYALDSGCLWGRELSAIRLEDQAVFQVPCQENG